MVALIQDALLEEELIAQRRATGADRHDEVWEGVYVMSPMANNQHQRIVGGLNSVFLAAVETPGLGVTLPGTNVTDRESDWMKNFRCPDVAVFLDETTAEDRETHWYGGPNFAVEIISPDDRTRQKFDFYARVNTRELLIVDRDPWALELYRLADGELQLVGKSTLDAPTLLESEVVPLSLKLIAGDNRPAIEVRHNDGKQVWTV